MDASAWVTAVSGLVGALIGAGAALFAQIVQLRSQAKTSADRERKEAVEEVLVRAQAIEMRSQESMVLAAHLGSFNGLASRLLGNLTPVDLQGMFDRLNEEANSLQRSAARIWLFADDEELVALTNAVVLAAMDVVEAHHLPRRGRLLSYAQVAIFGKFEGDGTELAEARRRLSRCRQALVRHARQLLGLADVDPYVSALDRVVPNPDQRDALN